MYQSPVIQEQLDEINEGSVADWRLATMAAGQTRSTQGDDGSIVVRAAREALVGLHAKSSTVKRALAEARQGLDENDYQPNQLKAIHAVIDELCD